MNMMSPNNVGCDKDKNPADFVISASSNTLVYLIKDLLATFPKLQKSGLITPCPLPAYFNIHRSRKRYSCEDVYVLNSFIDPELKSAPIYPAETKLGQIIKFLQDDLGRNDPIKSMKTETNKTMKEEKRENPANFVIYVPENNKELSQIIIDLLAKYKFTYPGNIFDMPTGNDYNHTFRVLRKDWFCENNEQKYFANTVHYYNNYETQDKSLPAYSASAQIGEIIRILKTPVEPDASKIPVIHGYTMEYDRDRKLVKFGCAEINEHFFRWLNTLHTSPSYIRGNRKISSINLDSGKTLSIDDIQNVSKYINYIKTIRPHLIIKNVIYR